MSTTTQVPTTQTSTTSAPTPTAERQPVWKHGVAAAVVASVATTVLAAVASAAGVSFADSTGASIPVAGVRAADADLLARRRRHGRRHGAQGAPAADHVRADDAGADLSLVSCPRHLTFGFDAGSAATLITLHAVAAAIVVPTVASRLARTR